MRSHVLNSAMRMNNQIASIELRTLPSGSQAVGMYHQSRGRFSEESAFGKEPLNRDYSKTA